MDRSYRDECSHQVQLYLKKPLPTTLLSKSHAWRWTRFQDILKAGAKIKNFAIGTASVSHFLTTDDQTYDETFSRHLSCTWKKAMISPIPGFDLLCTIHKEDSERGKKKGSASNQCYEQSQANAMWWVYWRMYEMILGDVGNLWTFICHWIMACPHKVETLHLRWERKCPKKVLLLQKGALALLSGWGWKPLSSRVRIGMRFETKPL